MEKFLIKGGNPLKGTIKASGAKNSVLKLMAASILTSHNSVIENVPIIQDVLVMAEVLRVLGAKVTFTENNSVEIKPDINNLEAPYELVSKMRASIIVLGPLLAKYKEVRVALPGGCNIGRRKIDLHLKGLEALGAKIEVKKGYIIARSKRLKGTHITLDFPSVGATENILMASVLASGETIIENAAREPELKDLTNYLICMGAKIKGKGTSTLCIKGVESLKGVTYRAISDRIETGTFLIAGIITEGKVRVKNGNANYLELVLEKLKESGAIINKGEDYIESSFGKELKAIDVATFPYPGFPTDLQPQISVMLSLAKGISAVTENIFENRYIYIDELNRMGTDINIEGHHAIIKGRRKLSGVPVQATDLRGGAALVLAALGAEGETIIENINHIDRGYENFDEKLRKLGAKIERVEN